MQAVMTVKILIGHQFVKLPFMFYTTSLFLLAGQLVDRTSVIYYCHNASTIPIVLHSYFLCLQGYDWWLVVISGVQNFVNLLLYL
jgi:hypothetical protein